MKFSDLSAADAELYRTVIEEDGPIRLAELAQLLQRDGQDLVQFDGSIESLVPLWTWFMEFAEADFPGIPSDATSRLLMIDESEGRDSRLRYASEFIAHYIFEVTKRQLIDVRWVVETRANMTSTHETRAQFTLDSGNKITADLFSWCKRMALALAMEHPTATAPDSLKTRAQDSILNFGPVTMNGSGKLHALASRFWKVWENQGRVDHR